MAQVHAKFRLNVNARAIRSTVGNGAHHPFQVALIPMANEPGNAAHEFSGLFEVDAFAYVINAFVLCLVVGAHDEFRHQPQQEANQPS